MGEDISLLVESMDFLYEIHFETIGEISPDNFLCIESLYTGRELKEWFDLFVDADVRNEINGSANEIYSDSWLSFRSYYTRRKLENDWKYT